MICWMLFLSCLGYGSGSAGALTGGTLKLRYCKRPFARLFPSWKLPNPDHVVGLVAWLSASGILDPSALVGGAGGPGGPWTGGAGGAGWFGLVGGPGGRWQSGSDSGTKRIRLTRKTPLPGVFPPLRHSQGQSGGNGCGLGVMRLALWS